MNPIDFFEANKTYTAPSKEDESWCGDLRTCETIDANEMPVIISCWKPSWRDRLRVLLGNPVWLTIVGTRLSPVNLRTDCPFNRVRNDGRHS